MTKSIRAGCGHAPASWTRRSIYCGPGVSKPSLSMRSPKPQRLPAPLFTATSAARPISLPPHSNGSCPPVTPPPSTGSLRDRLVELVCRQATLYEEAPLHPTTLAWIALRSTAGADDAQDWQRCKGTLQARVVEHYRQPFEAVLQSPDAHTQLDEFDLELAVCQLVGPLLSHG